MRDLRPVPSVTSDELDAQTVWLLPRRETLCQLGCVNVTNVVGVNLALAVNAATIGSSAHALALQQLSSVQG